MNITEIYTFLFLGSLTLGIVIAIIAYAKNVKVWQFGLIVIGFGLLVIMFLLLAVLSTH